MAELRDRGNDVPGMVGGQVSALRVVIRDVPSVRPTDCSGIFPESTGDLRDEAAVSFEVGTILGDDGDLLTSVEENLGSNEADHASTNYDSMGT